MLRRLLAGASLITIALTTFAVSNAAAAGPVYRDPPGYRGVTKAPATRPAPPPPASPAVTLSSTGVHPDVLIDEAGTAHIVWNEGRGDDADAAIYCRLKRGATACDATAVLTWEKSYDAGDGPEFNTDDGGPRIVRVGDQLVVLSKRYPTMGVKPDGASSHTVVAWSSNDGGTTWSSSAIFGKRNLGQVAVLGPDDDPTIVNLAHDPFCGGMCVTAFKSGQYSSAEGVLNTDPDSNYNATLVADGTGLVAGFSDLQPRIWLRRWSGAQPVTDPGTWSTAAPLAGDEPDLASGRSGTFLLQRPGYSGPYQIRPVATGGDGSLSPGAPVTLSKADGARFGRLAEDPSGRLLAAWQQTGTGVVLRTSTSGVRGFGDRQRLIDGDDNGQISLDAAADGGGFAVLNHTGGINSPGQIVAAGFGNQGPTSALGLGGLQGGSGAANVSCQRVRFGSFAIEALQGCFLNGTGRNSRLVVTGGPVTLNGVRIVPDPGARLVIDPERLRIDSIGQVRVLVSNGDTEVVLYHGVIQRDLSRVVPGARLFEFPAGAFKANVLGFEVSGEIPVVLGEGGRVRIPVDVKLPPAFGGFTGHAELLADAERGLALDSLKIHIGPVPLGVLVVESIDIDWTSGNTWSGRGRLRVPAGGTIQAFVEFENGEFRGAGFDYPLNPPATIGPFVYLISIGGDFFVQPVKIVARAQVGAGAAIQGESPVKVRGTFTMLFPPAAPASFSLVGDVDLFMLRIGGGYLQFQTDGYAQFGGNTQLDLGPLSGGAQVQGFVDATTGQFGADLKGDAQVCLEFPLPSPADPIRACGKVGTQAAVSDVGFAACARIEPDPLPSVSGGLALRWNEITPAVLASPVLLTAQIIDAVAIPCNTGPYSRTPPRPAPARAAQAGGQAVTIPGGLPSATIRVMGAGGRPDVEVRGPSGQVVSSGEPSDAGSVVGVSGADAAWVVLNKPQAGTWTVAPRSGSVALGEVQVSQGFVPARVSARVRRGRIAYRISGLGSGQRVAFRESGRFGTRIIATVKRTRGTVRFRPAAGPGGRRAVDALIERDGLVVQRRRVGTYVAPPPRRPAAVRGLKARKHGSSLTVRYRSGRGAARTMVVVRGSRGTRLARLVPAGRRVVRFGAVRWERRLRVEVRSLSDVGLAGPVRRVRARGG
ncbi:MAG: hypothetical protein R2736_12515 [Solirubrobacterales bacterium]